jgi:UDP-glucose 4-epimerase
MKILVFGGSGFLGSHVVDALTDAGHSVTMYDLKPSPYLKAEQKMIVGDILDFEAIQKAIIGADYVYNFAGIADLDDATTKPLTTIRLNVEGNVNILEACRLENVKRYVYASTIYVYSQKGGFYRCSKQASEIYIEEYNRRYNLSFTILRYGTLYGTRADDRNSIYRYLRQAIEEGVIDCSGTGEELREYINVADAARLSVEVLNEEYRNKYIIVTGHYPMKFKDMLLMIKEILGKDIRINLQAASNPDHYEYTPYSFTPKIGQKLVNHMYLDIGQGLLECINEMTQKKLNA